MRIIIESTTKLVTLDSHVSCFVSRSWPTDAMEAAIAKAEGRS